MTGYRWTSVGFDLELTLWFCLRGGANLRLISQTATDGAVIKSRPHKDVH